VCGKEVLLNLVFGCKANPVEKCIFRKPNFTNSMGSVLLEKLRGFHLVKNYLYFMEKQVSHSDDNNISPVPILSQINPVHALLSDFFKIQSFFFNLYRASLLIA
jgi:hypothetical protein